MRAKDNEPICEEGNKCPKTRLLGFGEEVHNIWEENPIFIIGILGAAVVILLIILFCIIKHLRKPNRREDILEPDTLKSGTYRSESNDYKSPDDGYFLPKVTAYSYTPAQPMSGSHSSVEDDGYIQPRTNSQDNCYLQPRTLDERPSSMRMYDYNPVTRK
ncbi:unnamed protein product [Oikopleura dioica]|uniref:Uncharacterized protein n=1 Tax=Oikopleura dioica TaxID=34765 RepID=E4X4M5_OIKDI|nr:unnamed protein product [Oikopleura dioica]